MPSGGQNKLTLAVLRRDLTGLARELGETPTQAQYRDQGRHSVKALRNEFGTWNGALEACGLGVNHRRNTRVTVECANCGADVEKQPSEIEYAEYSYCSQDCHYVHKQERYSGDGNPCSTLLDVVCAACGETLQRARWQREGHDRHFCDSECWGKWAENNLQGEDSPHWKEYPTNECEHCGKSYKTEPCHADETRFCSESCRDAGVDLSGENNPSWRGGPVEKTCQVCGDEYEVRQSLADGSKYCSYDCLYDGAHPSGEDHPRWNPDKEKLYYGPNWVEQRQKATVRDQARCQNPKCTMTESDSVRWIGIGLDVHHLRPLKHFKEESGIDYDQANDLSNLVTLCRRCHRKIESTSHTVPL